MAAPICDLFDWFAEQATAARVRTMREFAEQEIVLSTGPAANLRFDCSRQPFTGHWFDLVDSGRWPRRVITGPSQSGKTLIGFVIPILYHLFELQESVICGLPSLTMSADKWYTDLLPIIEKTRYRAYLPVKGAGSRGGKVDRIQFTNGVSLKFISGGGNDKTRAGSTARVLVVTETDGMDEIGGKSREADKISQMEARTQAFGSEAITYLECTVSTASGRTWKEYTGGTATQIQLRCPHCDQYVLPERSNFVNWRDADNVIEAQTNAAFACPSCGATWTEEERRQANLQSRAVHTNPAPTDTLGFRWSAVHNLLMPSTKLASVEWRASKEQERDAAERKLKQFFWCIPVTADDRIDQRLSPQIVSSKAEANDVTRGICPAGTDILTICCDVGRYQIHYTTIAWRAERGDIVDYGVELTGTDEIGEKQGIELALSAIADRYAHGLPVGTADGPLIPLTLGLVDSGYLTDTVYRWAAKRNRWRPFKGRGSRTYRSTTPYTRPESTAGRIQWIGHEMHSVWLKDIGVALIEANTDYWKEQLQARMATAGENTSTICLFTASAREHTTFTKHLFSEKATERYVVGRGTIVQWVKTTTNHYLDTTYMNLVAHQIAKLGVKPQTDKPPVAGAPQEVPKVTEQNVADMAVAETEPPKPKPPVQQVQPAKAKAKPRQQSTDWAGDVW